MNKFFWPFLFLLWLLFGAWVCKGWLCNIGGAAPLVAAAATTSDDTCDTSLKISDGNFTSRTNTNVKFLRSDHENVLYSDKVNSSFKKTASYLKEHADRLLNISGVYNLTEANSSAMAENLGVARANTVKNILVGLGAPSNQIRTTGVSNDACFKNGVAVDNSKSVDNSNLNVGTERIDTLMNGVRFDFSNNVMDEGRVTAIKNRLLGKPITLYFETNAASINLTAQQRKDFADLRYYIENVANSRLDIDGHTDSVGNRTRNLQLSRERAEFVRSYIVKNGGISNERMKPQGFGPDKPVADNNRTKGRELNRRVEVILR